MFFRKIHLQLKSIKNLFFFPLVIVHIFLPLISYIMSMNQDISFFEYFIIFSQMLTPISSVMWTMFILIECIDGKGNELLFVANNRNKLFDCLTVFGLFFITIVIQFLLYSFFEKAMLAEILRLFFICLLFFGVTYFLVFLTKSIALTLMGLIIYIIVNVIVDGHDEKVSFIKYINFDYYDKELFINQSLPMLGISIVFIIIGFILNKKYCKYN